MINYHNTEIIFGYKLCMENIEEVNFMLIINPVEKISIFKDKKKIVAIILGEVVGASSVETIPAIISQEERKMFTDSRKTIINFLYGYQQTNLKTLKTLIKVVNARINKDGEFAKLRNQFSNVTKEVLISKRSQTMHCPEHFHTVLSDYAKTKSVRSISKSDTLEFSL